MLNVYYIIIYIFFPLVIYLHMHFAGFSSEFFFLAAKTKIKGRSSEVIGLNLNQILPPLTSTVPLSLIFHF